jgi:hypothetical protein
MKMTGTRVGQAEGRVNERHEAGGYLVCLRSIKKAFKQLEDTQEGGKRKEEM